MPYAQNVICIVRILFKDTYLLPFMIKQLKLFFQVWSNNASKVYDVQTVWITWRPFLVLIFWINYQIITGLECSWKFSYILLHGNFFSSKFSCLIWVMKHLWNMYAYPILWNKYIHWMKKNFKQYFVCIA